MPDHDQNVVRIRTAYTRAVEFIRAEERSEALGRMSFDDAVGLRLDELNGNDDLGLPGEIAQLEAFGQEINAAFDQQVLKLSHDA